MLRDTGEESVFHVERESTLAPGHRRDVEPRWRAVDRALRKIASRRAALDAEEARWLQEAEALQIWRPLGMVSAIDYLERVLGYAPRTAQDRLRVARALGSLPQLTDALSRGDLSFSAVRELTRVATGATEAAWLTAATGKNLRQIEELVADHRPGDDPDDPPDPGARMHVVRFELAAETFALLRQARTTLDEEHHTNLADDAFVAALCSAALEGSSTAETDGRARFQIALTLCRRCQQGWQEGGGAQIAVSVATVDRAMCDAQHIGSIDGPAPERAHQDIPPSVVRFVWRRDGGRCRVPGCRSARGLELHHLVHRADGGSHDAGNLALICGRCHQSHHAGVLTISGTADRLEVRRPGQQGWSADPQARSAGTSEIVGAARNTAPLTAMPAGVDEEPDQLKGPPVCLAMNTTPSIAVTIDVDAASDAHVDVSGAHGSMTEIGVVPGVDPARIPVTRAHVRAAPGRGQAQRAQAQVGPKPVACRDAHVGVSSVEHPATAGAPPYGPTNTTSFLGVAILRTQAKAALTGLGWKPAIAHAAVSAALGAHRTDVTLERLIFESLRRCPVAKTT